MNNENKIFNNSLSRIANIPFLGGLLPVFLFIVSALFFLPQQSVWVDETTQLSGLTLGPIEILGWLLGKFDPFLVPTDNSPPISYWVGMLWSSVFGLSVPSLRLCSVFLVSLAVLVVYEAGRFGFGFRSGLTAGLLFALSPNVIEQSTIIRSYALYMLVAACAIYCLMRFLRNANSFDWKWLVGIVAFSIVEMYTHLFGILLGASLLLAVLVTVWRAHGRLKPVFVAIAVVGLAALGLVPFILTMLSHLGGYVGDSGSGLTRGIIRFFYRQFAHPAMSVSNLTIAVAAVAFATLMVLAVIRKGSNTNRRDALLIALAAGYFVIILGRVFLTSLMTEIRYNLWLVPGLYVFLSSSLTASHRRTAFIGVFAAILLLGADTYAASQLAFNGKYFSKSRSSDVISTLKHFNLDETTFIHEGEVGHMYFPLVYIYGPKSKHYFLRTDKSNNPVLLKTPKLEPVNDLSSIHTQYLVTLQTKSRRASEIVDQLKNGPKPLSEGLFPTIFRDNGGWRLKTRRSYLSFYQTDLSVYEQRVPNP